jgi:aldehyde dehydrogenase (NAD+)
MTIKEIFDTMDYGPAPESASEALAWIASHGGRFGCFIDGRSPSRARPSHTRNPANGETLAEVTQATQSDVDRAVPPPAPRKPGWAALGRPWPRPRPLRHRPHPPEAVAPLRGARNARQRQAHPRSRDIDIPLAIRHFYHHAGYAELQETELAGRAPLGVCGQVIPWNFPLLMLAWKVAPALAMGNTVVLKPAEYTSLSALLFADLCRQAGVPPGVVNVVTGDGRVGEMVVKAPVEKVAFTGSTAVGRIIREATAGTGKALTLELGGKSPYIVFDDADLDSAVEGLVDAIWFNQGQVCCAREPPPRARRGLRPPLPQAARRMDKLASATRSTRPSTSARSWTRCSLPRSPASWTPTRTASATSPHAPFRPLVRSTHPPSSPVYPPQRP